MRPTFASILLFGLNWILLYLVVVAIDLNRQVVEVSGAKNTKTKLFSLHHSL